MMRNKNRPMNFQRGGGNKRHQGGGGGFNNNNRGRHRRFGQQRQGARTHEGKTKAQALQMREKFQHLAREAQMGGDRVQMEYYLQYADHYTRIVDFFEAEEREAAAAFGDEFEGEGSEGEGDAESDTQADGDDAGEGEQPQAGQQQGGQRQQRPQHRQQGHRPVRQESREDDGENGNHGDKPAVAPSMAVPAMGLPLPPAFPSFRAPETLGGDTAADEADDHAPAGEEQPRQQRSRGLYGRRRETAEGEQQPRQPRAPRQPRTEAPKADEQGGNDE